MTDDYDVTLVDIGGDEVLVIHGPPDPDVISAELVRFTDRRLARLRGGPPDRVRLWRWWLRGHHVYAVRRHLEVTVWWDVPPLQVTLAHERDLGLPADGLALLSRFAASGLLLGRGYSTACPDGETGSVHVCDVEAVDREAFAAARRRGWR